MARRRWAEKRKAELLAKCASSGLSAAAFCREHGLPYQSFLEWRRGAADGPPQDACGLEFAEFEVEAPGARRDGAGPGPTVELVLGGGMVLRVYAPPPARP